MSGVGVPILLEKNGHFGHGDPADIRLPAKEFYMVGGHGGYMAEGFRDGLPAKPKDPRMDLRKGVGASAPITKNQPLHVDGVAERKRRELEYYRDINVDINGQGEGCSGVTWMRGRGQVLPVHEQPPGRPCHEHHPRQACPAGLRIDMLSFFDAWPTGHHMPCPDRPWEYGA